MRDGDAQDNDLRCRVDDIDSELTIDDLVQILQGGGVVALPTDTFYCLAACAINAEAALRVFEIKRRQATSAVPLLTAEASDVMKYAVDLTEAQQTAVIALGARFWPGPLSLVLKRSPANSIPPFWRRRHDSPTGTERANDQGGGSASWGTRHGHQCKPVRQSCRHHRGGGKGDSRSGGRRGGRRGYDTRRSAIHAP